VHAPRLFVPWTAALRRTIAGVRRSVITLATAGAGALLALVAAGPGGSAAAAACTQTPPSAAIDLARGDRAALRVGAGGELLVDGSPCGSALVAELDSIVTTGGGGDQRLVIDLRGGAFGDAVIDVRLGAGDGDVLAIAGSSTADELAIGAESVDLDGAGTSRVGLAGVNRVTASTGGGADRIDGSAHQRRLKLAGEAGADDLTGGGGRDRIAGGRGDDRCWGGPKTDTLLSCSPPFDPSVSEIDADLRDRMTGRSWRPGCPVGLGDLRLLKLRHWTMGDRDVHRGELVVHRGRADEVVRAMHSLFAKRYPIRRMKLIDAYGADDHRSMNADNTSAFNCRFVAGTSRWSQHAFGRALDLNPVENPYVSGSHVSPPAGRRYRSRPRRPGVIHAGDATVRAFRRVGWEWGGSWPGTKDYQHFSANGR
jgi:poly-gamma-glutamate synthesis protein (capsule biosynthesis protein)